MHTVTLKVKLLSPNKGKQEKMARMLETYRKACSWFLKQAEALNITSRTKLNRKTTGRHVNFLTSTAVHSSAPCSKHSQLIAHTFPG